MARTKKTTLLATKAARASNSGGDGGTDSQITTAASMGPKEANDSKSGGDDSYNCASLSIGDTVRIKGLATARQYNGLTGLVVSAVDSDTNRCGVQFRYDGKIRRAAIQMQNLVLLKKAKKSTSEGKYEDFDIPPEILSEPSKNNEVRVKKHVVVAMTFGDESRTSKLQEQNMSWLRNFEDAASEDEMTSSIIMKWREQRVFVRFVNGITSDCRSVNLQVVSLTEAMDHINDWKVDWDMDLSCEEIELVKSPTWRLGFLKSLDIKDEDIDDEDHDSCYKAIQEKVEGDHNHVELTGPATGQAVYPWESTRRSTMEGDGSSSSSSSSSSGDDDADDFDDDDDDGDDDSSENELTDSIIRKWQMQNSFIRFMNGNKGDCRIANLRSVSLDDAMDHIDDWAVDWDMNLTQNEIELVRNPVWRAGLLKPTQLYPEARLAYNNWCATYGKVPSEARCAAFLKNYAGQARANAMALAAGTEPPCPVPFEFGECGDLTYAEQDALGKRFDHSLWLPLLHEEASLAYENWCDEYGKEPSEAKFVAFMLNFISAILIAPNDPKLTECADMTEVELAAISERHQE